jgi:hypothetical protein
MCFSKYFGRDRVVDIMTCYGLDVSGIESQRGTFLHPSTSALRTNQSPRQWVAVPLPRAKRQGRDVNHPPHLAPRLKKEFSYTPTLPLGFRGLL